jgi:hypothetical protein
MFAEGFEKTASAFDKGFRAGRAVRKGIKMFSPHSLGRGARVVGKAVGRNADDFIRGATGAPSRAQQAATTKRRLETAGKASSYIGAGLGGLAVGAGIQARSGKKKKKTTSRKRK